MVRANKIESENLRGAQNFPYLIDKSGYKTEVGLEFVRLGSEDILKEKLRSLLSLLLLKWQL